MGSKSSSPAAPNFGGLATQQGQLSQNLINQQTAANRPTTTTPFGSTAWNYNPSTGQWSGNQSYNPTLTDTLNTQEHTGAGQAQTQQTEAGAAGNLLNKDLSTGAFNPVDYSKSPQVGTGNYYDPKAQNAVWNEFQTMEQPLMNQQTESQQAQLEGQGLRPGDEAYDTAMRNLSNTQYQQTQAAQDQAVLAGEQEAQTMQGMDLTAHNSAVNDQNMQQNQNFNMFNSLFGAPQTNYGSSQIPTAASGLPQTPDLLGAAEQTYGANLNSTNASNAANGNLWNGLTGLLGSGLQAYGGGGGTGGGGTGGLSGIGSTIGRMFSGGGGGTGVTLGSAAAGDAAYGSGLLNGFTPQLADPGVGAATDLSWLNGSDFSAAGGEAAGIGGQTAGMDASALGASETAADAGAAGADAAATGADAGAAAGGDAAGGAAGLGGALGATAGLAAVMAPAIIGMSTPAYSMPASFYQNMNDTLAKGPGTGADPYVSGSSPEGVQYGNYLNTILGGEVNGDAEQKQILQRFGFAPNIVGASPAQQRALQNQGVSFSSPNTRSVGYK